MCFFTLKTSALVIVLIMEVALVAPNPEDCIARNDEGRGCKLGNNNIPQGNSASLEKPCVHVTCSPDGRNMTVIGCPLEGGRHPHPGTPPVTGAHRGYPYCCDKCNTVS
ncbi:uncharacterized protein LOC142590372 isoform X2 [Dermacentor variabilis]